MMLLSKKDYHKCDFTLKHVDYVDTFTNEHNGLRMFLKNCNNLMEHYELIKFIESLVRKEGEWVIGALEGSSTFLTTTRDLNNNLLMNVIGKEVILRVVDKYKKENSGILVEKIDLSDFKYKNHVSEITTKIGLMYEGKKMGHCVGGYSYPIIDGRSRIFHIEYNGIGSTVEIGLPVNKLSLGWAHISYGNTRDDDGTIREVYQNEETPIDMCMLVKSNGVTEKIELNKLILYRVNQHYGRFPEMGNLTPIDESQEIVRKLVQYLNMNHLPDNFKINPKSFADKEDSSIFV